MTNTDEACCWYPNRQELHVNLLSVIGIHSTLIMGSWNHRSSGINLSLVTDDGIEHYDPFTAPYFQISDFLNVCAAKPYLDQIPAEVLNAVQPYRSDSYGIVMILSQYKFLTDLCRKYSTLFWLIFRKAKIDHWSKCEFLDVCNHGESAMLIACGLPANNIALEAIAKFTANNFAQLQSDYIHRLFTELDYQHLNTNLEHIPDHLIQFLLRYPELQHAKLIQSLNRADYNELLRIVRNLPAVAAKIDTVNELIAESDNIPALKSHYKRLEALALEKALKDYEKQLKSAEASSRSFPQLLMFVDRDDLVQILSEVDLLAESWLCRQNLMSYVPGILSEHYAVYRMLKPQRATAVYYLFPEQDGGLRPVLKYQYIVDALIKL
jgi:hypothetical protein